MSANRDGYIVMDALFSLLIIYMAVTLISAGFQLKHKEKYDVRCDEMTYLWQDEDYLAYYDPAYRKKQIIEEMISLLPLVKPVPQGEIKQISMLALP